jgi:hypothetical protein
MQTNVIIKYHPLFVLKYFTPLYVNLNEETVQMK